MGKRAATAQEYRPEEGKESTGSSLGGGITTRTSRGIFTGIIVSTFLWMILIGLALLLFGV